MNEWITWTGGPRPVPAESRVQVRMRSLIPSAAFAELPRWYVAGDIESWEHSGSAGDILAYRVVAA